MASVRHVSALHISGNTLDLCGNRLRRYIARLNFQ